MERPRSNSRGNFKGRSDRDSRGPRRDNFGGRDSNRGFSRGRDSGRDRKSTELYDVVCDKCKKKTQVPFKPSGNKPVLCRDCFDAGGSGRDNSRGFGRDRSAPRVESSGMSQDQFKQINVKLDKILKILEEVTEEFEEDDYEEEDDEVEKD